MATPPLLSIVSPVWNQLDHTRRFVDSVRRATDVPYELVLVDNGSDAETAAFLRDAADAVVRHEENRGFAAGMNAGLERASGTYVAFCNNDIEVPDRWASQLVAHLEDETVGIVVPSVTKSLRPRNVRAAPGELVERLDPFESPPSAIVYGMRTDVARELGGFSEEYRLASGEDTDLAFTVWVNGLAIVYDSRVLVWHHSKGTASSLDDWETLWQRNRKVFLDKWTGAAPNVPRLGRCTAEAFAERLAVARSVATWMGLYLETRDKLKAERRRRLPLATRLAERLRSRSARRD
jgi:O-antigen biosynthesis protein